MKSEPPLLEVVSSNWILEPVPQPYRNRIFIGHAPYIRDETNLFYCDSHYSSIVAKTTVVWVGDHVKIGNRCIIKDNCIVEKGVTLGDDSVIPPFTRISVKNPSSYQELPPSVAAQMQELSLDRYADFKQEQREKQ